MWGNQRRILEHRGRVRAGKANLGLTEICRLKPGPRTCPIERSPGGSPTIRGVLGDPASKQAGKKKVGKTVREVGN